MDIKDALQFIFRTKKKALKHALWVMVTLLEQGTFFSVGIRKKMWPREMEVSVLHERNKKKKTPIKYLYKYI